MSLRTQAWPQNMYLCRYNHMTTRELEHKTDRHRKTYRQTHEQTGEPWEKHTHTETRTDTQSGVSSMCFDVEVLKLSAPPRSEPNPQALHPSTVSPATRSPKTLRLKPNPLPRLDPQTPHRSRFQFDLTLLHFAVKVVANVDPAGQAK